MIMFLIEASDVYCMKSKLEQNRIAWERIAYTQVIPQKPTINTDWNLTEHGKTLFKNKVAESLATIKISNAYNNVASLDTALDLLQASAYNKE